MKYRFDSDPPQKIRDLPVQNTIISGGEFCSLLMHHCFNEQVSTCTFIPVNCELTDKFSTQNNGTVVIRQEYGDKFKTNVNSDGFQNKEIIKRRQDFRRQDFRRQDFRRQEFKWERKQKRGRRGRRRDRRWGRGFFAVKRWSSPRNVRNEI